ncbi:MAG: ABC transporter permease [Eubacteriales bacterium]
MYTKTLRAEMTKLRRSPVWLPFFLVPLLPAVMGTFNYLQNTAILTQEWYSLWTQHTLFLCYFFFPILIGVYTAYLLRLEHTHHNWNAMMSAPVKPVYLYLAKLTLCAVMVCLTQLWIGLLFIISGKLCGFTTPIPPELLVWLVSGMLGGLVIATLQYCLSLVIKSFAVPVGISLAGGIAGFVAFAKGLGVWFPYSLYSLGMRANDPGGALAVHPLLYIGNSLLFIILGIIFSSLWMSHKDINT